MNLFAAAKPSSDLDSASLSGSQDHRPASRRQLRPEVAGLEGRSLLSGGSSGALPVAAAEIRLTAVSVQLTAVSVQLTAVSVQLTAVSVQLTAPSGRLTGGGDVAAITKGTVALTAAPEVATQRDIRELRGIFRHREELTSRLDRLEARYQQRVESGIVDERLRATITKAFNSIARLDSQAEAVLRRIAPEAAPGSKHYVTRVGEISDALLSLRPVKGHSGPAAVQRLGPAAVQHFGPAAVQHFGPAAVQQVTAIARTTATGVFPLPTIS